MRGTVYGPGDVRFEERDVPAIIKPTDAIIRISATCVCGSDLWPYRGTSCMSKWLRLPLSAEFQGAIELARRIG
jgi:threonine dehydrogenase-like Zn-dependent dehydrogenase